MASEEFVQSLMTLSVCFVVGGLCLAIQLALQRLKRWLNLEKKEE
jgi:hypothetical protein